MSGIVFPFVRQTRINLATLDTLRQSSALSRRVFKPRVGLAVLIAIPARYSRLRAVVRDAIIASPGVSSSGSSIRA